MNFDDFFTAATGNLPYDYQSRLAGNDAGTECRSQLISIPTGLGKATAIPDAEVLWVDIEPDPKGELLLPYSKEELDNARKALAALTEASPRALREVNFSAIKQIRPVIRRRDLMDLFDATPDLRGQDLDISRYIRDGEDLQFYWRSVALGDRLAPFQLACLETLLRAADMRASVKGAANPHDAD